MAGQDITASTIEEATKQVFTMLNKISIEVDEITREEYEAFDKSEREDSDNHLNLDRLGPDTKIVDLVYYKFLDNRKTAYRVDLVDLSKKVKKQLFFITLPREDQ